MICSLGHAVNHTLHGCRDLTQGPHLEARVAELAALQVGHLEAEAPHQLVVNQGGGGSREMRGCETRKRPPLTTEHIFLLLICILVKCCWFSFDFHFYFKGKIAPHSDFSYRINFTGLEIFSHQL